MTIGLRESSLRKESAIKNCHKFFSKKHTSSLKDIKWTERLADKSEKYTLCMFLEVIRIKRIPGPRHLYMLYQVNLRDGPLENFWARRRGEEKYKKKIRVREN